MRVLMLSHEKNLNGASKSMLNLIDSLKGSVEFVVVVSFDSGPVYDELKARNILCLYYPMKRWVKIKKSRLDWIKTRLKWYCYWQFYNKKIACDLVKQIRNMDIDLIHTNVSVLNVGALLSKKTGIPHVWYIREFGKEDFSMFPLCSEKYYYRTIDSCSNAVITVSRALKTKMDHYISESKVVAIHNGVGRENLLEDKIYGQDSECTFLISGTLQKGKGQDIAVKAVDELLRRGVENFKLLFAGRGDNEWLTTMPEYDKNHCRFLGQVDDMVSVRKTSDVELVCSRCEAFGRVTAEAMLAGMPVIGSNSGGTPELIEDSVTGFLFEPGNHIMLSDRMQYFIENREEVKNMGIKAMNYGKKHFLIEECADIVFRVYQTAISNRGG